MSEPAAVDPPLAAPQPLRMKLAPVQSNGSAALAAPTAPAAISGGGGVRIRLKSGGGAEFKGPSTLSGDREKQLKEHRKNLQHAGPIMLKNTLARNFAKVDADSEGVEVERPALRLRHQRIQLSVNFDRQSLSGSTELAILFDEEVAKYAIDPVRIDKISLNCMQMKIFSVLVDGSPVTFQQQPAITELSSEDYDAVDGNIGKYVELLEGKSANEQLGHVVIDLPTPFRLAGPLSCVIKVNYEVRKSDSAIQFVNPWNEDVAARPQHMFISTNSSGPGAIVPCFDHHDTVCQWQFDLTIPAAMKAVCPGSLESSTRHVMKDKAGNRVQLKTSVFKCDVPMSARNIGFSIGQFVVHKVPDLPFVTTFALPACEGMLQDTVEFLPYILNLASKFLGFAYPFEQLKIVFVDDSQLPIAEYPSLLVCSTQLLHTERIIDQVFLTRQLLCQAISRQFFGLYLDPARDSDAWLVSALASYVSDHLQAKLFGFNERSFRIYQDMNALCTDRAKPKLEAVNFKHLTLGQYSHSQTRAFLVLRMLSHIIGTENFHTALKAYLTSLDSLYVDSQSFYKKLRKTFDLSKRDNETLHMQWVAASGWMGLSGSYAVDEGRGVVTVRVHQDRRGVPPAQVGKAEPYRGKLKIKVNGVHGPEIYDDLFISDFQHVFEINYPKNKKKNKKATPRSRTKAKTKAIEAAAATAGSAAPGADGGTPGPEGARTPHSPEGTQGAPSEPVPNGAVADQDKPSSVHYLILDPDTHWISQVSMEQTPKQWLAQALEERDIIQQCRAITELINFDLEIVYEGLVKIIKQKRFYHRVRVRACEVLRDMTNRYQHEKGGLCLINAFKELYFTQSGIIKPNDFHDISEYFVEKDMLTCIGGLGSLATPQDTKKFAQANMEFALSILEYEDNTENFYSNNYFLSSCIDLVHSCLMRYYDAAYRSMDDATATAGRAGGVRINGHGAGHDQLVHRAVEAIVHAHNLDKVLPSYHNMITVSSISAYGGLMAMGVLSFSPEVFHSHAQYGNLFNIRVVALRESLRFVKGLSGNSGLLSKVLRFVIEIAYRDHHAQMRFEALSALIELLDVKDLPFDRLMELKTLLWRLFIKKCRFDRRCFALARELNRRVQTEVEERTAVGQASMPLRISLSKFRNALPGASPSHIGDRSPRYEGAMSDSGASDTDMAGGGFKGTLRLRLGSRGQNSSGAPPPAPRMALKLVLPQKSDISSLPGSAASSPDHPRAFSPTYSPAISPPQSDFEGSDREVSGTSPPGGGASGGDFTGDGRHAGGGIARGGDRSKSASKKGPDYSPVYEPREVPMPASSGGGLKLSLGRGRSKSTSQLPAVEPTATATPRPVPSVAEPVVSGTDEPNRPASPVYAPAASGPPPSLPASPAHAPTPAELPAVELTEDPPPRPKLKFSIGGPKRRLTDPTHPNSARSSGSERLAPPNAADSAAAKRSIDESNATDGSESGVEQKSAKPKLKFKMRKK
eukprot:Clim_evm74s210 gene=Clim_evmTU74s210